MRGQIVTELFDGFIGGMIASRAILVSLPAALLTGRGLALVRCQIVTELLNGFIGSMIASRAILVCLPAALLAGRGLALVRGQIVTQRPNYHAIFIIYHTLGRAVAEKLSALASVMGRAPGLGAGGLAARHVGQRRMIAVIKNNYILISDPRV